MAGWGETVFKRHFLDKCRIKSSSHSRSESLHKEGSNQNFRAFIKSLKSEHIHSFLGRLKTLSCSLNMAFINCVAMKKKWVNWLEQPKKVKEEMLPCLFYNNKGNF